jgi:glycosyltransferase involved in cell wall biosynthesis
MEPRKDVGVLVDAFARGVAGKGLPHRLVLVGPGGWLAEQADLARAAEPLGGRVVFTGPVGRDGLRALYRGADLFALPSRHEGFGLPVVEAMAQATPVVASDLPVLREVGGPGARYLAPGDVVTWADAVNALLTDPTARAALATAGLAHAATYTWARSAAKHLALYRSLL